VRCHEAPQASLVRAMAASDAQAIARLDRDATGWTRPQMLRRLAQLAQGYVLLRDGTPRGYAFCRLFGRGHVIGPVVADSLDDARALIEAALAPLGRTFVRLNSRLPTMGDDATLLLLDKDVVERLLSPAEVTQAVRDAFMLHGRREGRVFPVVREQLATGGVFGIKSGDVPSQGLLGFKAAGFWPRNREAGGEPHQATILLFDPATGRPQCVIDGNAITTVRTGAAGGLGLEMLARPDSSRLTVFGTGVQAKSQLRFALRVLPELSSVQYVSADRRADSAFESMFAQQCDIRCARDADQAVSESDVVITATPGAGPLFDSSAVRAGTHLNCVGADTAGKRELPAGLLQRARLVVDDREQALQLGEMQWARETPCVELGPLLLKEAPFLRAASDITVFDMTGLALQDLTVARLVYERACAQSLGSRIGWPW
jgi:ornithine cyclodeaminase